MKINGVKSMIRYTDSKRLVYFQFVLYSSGEKRDLTGPGQPKNTFQFYVNVHTLMTPVLHPPY